MRSIDIKFILNFSLLRSLSFFPLVLQAQPGEQESYFSQQQMPPPTIPSNEEERLPLVTAPRVRYEEILDFWFGSLPGPEYFPIDKLSIWFADSVEVNRQIRENFSQYIVKAMRGELNSWRETPRGRLALILLLHQFPRHIYPNQPRAFLSDPMARGLVLEGLKEGDDEELYPIERAFFYLPLEHSEDLESQNLSVNLYRQLVDQSPIMIKPQMLDFLRSAVLHQQQIARFGRFPHRNAILGRESTPVEIIFLTQSRRNYNQ